MIHRQSEGVRWLEFELLKGLPIIHGCFMRHGGISSGLLSSLNLGRSVGDEPGNVTANYRKIEHALSLKGIVSAKLIHGDDVSVITLENFGNIPISDALTTSLPKCAIAVTQADCQAAIFYDPVNHAMANVHCGWRGSVLDIYAATIRSMKAIHGTNTSDLLVCVSPSLGPTHAEFVNFHTELPEDFWQFRVKDNFFDFWSISRWQLEKAGILKDHIQIAGEDTYSNLDYFSHRRSTHENLGKCGRQATICTLS
ncbi:MAG TPA: polyphenol oxidase family protein [Parachlamydiaceae bacterium]|nr:polyphenol oxidase family protein [Parachlamydiaceae bacterium]